MTPQVSRTPARTRATSSPGDWVPVAVFDSTYYSGLELALYLGDAHIAEVVGLTFSVQEQVMPLYGYADYTFRRIRSGVRQISGAFTINFRRPGYLLELLSRLRNAPTGTVPPTVAARPVAGGSLGAANGERIGTGLAGADLSSVDSFNDYLRAGADFQDLAGAARAALWGAQAGAAAGAALPTGGSGGDVPVPDGLAGIDSPLFATSDTGFRLRLSWQPPEDGIRAHDWAAALAPPTAHAPDAPKVQETLVGCALTGFQRVVDDSGRPIMESYGFLARDYRPH